MTLDPDALLSGVVGLVLAFGLVAAGPVVVVLAILRRIG